MNKLKIDLREALSTLVLVVGLFTFRSAVADQYVIPSGSMLPTIEIGDHVLVNKLAYRLGEPERGDVIVFHDPVEPGRHLIKRLIGLPGDRLRVVDGRIQLNGQPLEVTATEEQLGPVRHRVQWLPTVAPHLDQEVEVPPGHYFFMGDNRDNSADSRYWGFAPREALEGKALRVIYNVSWDGFVPRVSLSRAGEALSLPPSL